MVITKFEEMAMEKRSIEIAKRLLHKNYNIEEISEITELPIEEIQKLINEK